MCGACRTRRLNLTILAMICLAGCSASQPEFHEREETADLTPEARQYVRDQLAARFGSPTESVAWEALPVRFHSARATVEDVTGGREFTISFESSSAYQTLPIETGDEVVWLSGGLVGQDTTFVQTYDADTQTVRLTNNGEAAPGEAIQPGDRVAIGAGRLLQHGRLLYAEHCQHCHGVGGDGAGPTAEYLNPRPRDYRSGIFKFTSTNSTRRAQRDDLVRVIENGIPGTYMPSFKLLEQEEMDAILDYVLWLSMRGETELKLVGDPDFKPPLVGLLSEQFSSEAVADLPARAQQQLEEFQQQLDSASDENQAAILRENVRIARDDVADPSRIAQRDFEDSLEYLDTDMEERVYGIIISDWELAQEASALVMPTIPRPPSDPASIARGREVFLKESAKCATCHGEAGLGNGESTLTVGVGNTEPGLFDAWGNELQPRNLTTGIYRGGRRPLDIYRRIHSGIKGTPMSGFGTALTEEEIWDLVNYVLSMPYEERELGAGAGVAAEPAATPEVASATDN